MVGQQLFRLDAGLEGMRAGHIGRGEPLRRPVRVVGAAAIGGCRAVGDAGSDVRHAGDVGRHAGLPGFVPLRDRRAVAGFEQQPLGQRRVVGGLDEAIRLELIRAHIRFDRVDCTD